MWMKNAMDGLGVLKRIAQKKLASPVGLTVAMHLVIITNNFHRKNTIVKIFFIPTQIVIAMKMAQNLSILILVMLLQETVLANRR